MLVFNWRVLSINSSNWVNVLLGVKVKLRCTWNFIERQIFHPSSPLLASCRWVCWLTRWRRRERRFAIWTYVWMSTGRNSTPQRRCCSRCVTELIFDYLMKPRLKLTTEEPNRTELYVQHRRVVLNQNFSFIYHCRSFCAERLWRRRNSIWCLKCPTSSWSSTLWTRRDWTLTDLGTVRLVSYI